MNTRIMNYFEWIPKEIIVEIFGNLEVKDLVSLDSINLFRKIIRETKWDHQLVKLKNVDAMIYAMKHYQFKKYDFEALLITDEILKLLVNWHTLNLSRYSQITDEGVKLLGNCHTLVLNNCHQITNESVKFLGKCHTLKLLGCDKITDESVKLLGDCHILDLSFCDQITDESVKHLGNCHILDLWNCKKITLSLFRRQSRQNRAG